MRWISMNTGRGVRRCGRLFCRPSDLGLTFPPSLGLSFPIYTIRRADEKASQMHPLLPA